MTVIVGVASDDGKRVVMGADSMSASSQIQHRAGDPKVYRKSVPVPSRPRLGDRSPPVPPGTRRPMLVGASGSWRLCQLLRYRLEPPEDAGDDPDRYMAVEFSDALRSLFKEHGYAKKENDKEQAKVSVLAAYRGRLYWIQNEYDVIPAAEGYAATGAGEYVAMGALHATREMTDPRLRTEIALAAACAHNPWCAVPFQVEEL